jgi:sodium transport system permease protein
MMRFSPFMEGMVRMMDKRLWVIVRKELMRVFTDRRLVITVLLLPGFSIALIYSIMGMAVGSMEADRSVHNFAIETYQAPSSFVEYVERIPSARVELTQIEDSGELEESKAKLVDEKIDLVMVFDKDFDVAIVKYEDSNLPNIDTYFNPINRYSQDARYHIINALLKDYKLEIIGKRLGDLSYTQVFSIDVANQEISVASESKIAGKMISSVLPILISVFLFAGAMGIGIDMVAGEKERGTMAMVLLTPIKRETVAIGKIISLGIVAIAATISSMMGVILSFPFSSRILGGSASQFQNMVFTPMQIGLLVLSLLILVGIYVGLIVMISVASKTVKEAGSYISPVYMVVLISGVLAVLGGSEMTTTQYMIPIYGNIIILQQIFAGEVEIMNFLINAIESIAVIGVLIVMIKKMFYNENLMFK